MNKLTFVIALGLSCVSTITWAQSWQPPSPTARCPSKWGAGDERGAGNHMTPATVLRAARLIKTGEAIELAHPLGAGMPLSPTRQFNDHTKRTFMNQPSEPAREQRGAAHQRDRPGRHAVRRVRPPVDREQPLRLLQDRGHRDAHRLHEARHREGRCPDDARGPHRRGGAQGRGCSATRTRSPCRTCSWRCRPSASE